MTSRVGPAGTPEPWPNLRRLLLALGFLAVSVGLLVAWDAPAGGYEVSIYTATPWLFWVAAALGLGLGAIVCAINPRDRVALYGLSLGGYATMAIASLPMARDFHYLGAADALTHLGYATDLRTDLITPSEILYPGGHAAAIVLGEGFGLPMQRAMMLWVLILLGVFLVSMPLLARAIVDHPSVTVIAGFSAFLLLPFNNVSTFYQFHTYSLGVMLSPLFGYLLVKHLQSGALDRSVLERLGGWNALLIGIGVSMLFIHPQVKLNIVILLGTFAAVHAISRRRYVDHPLAKLRSTMGSFLVLTVLWFAWSFQHWQPAAAIGNVLAATYYTAIGEQRAGQAAADVGESSEQIGASLAELFVKMFLVSSMYALLAAVVVIVAVLATMRSRYRQDYSVITYVGFGGVVLAPFFLLHFLGDVSQYFFRHLGFAMTFVTVLGALGVFYLAGGIAGTDGSPTLRTVGVGFLAVAIVLSVPVMFASPYIYLPSSQVSHGEVSGYETAFEYTDEETGWSGVRAGPGRFFDALTPGLRPIEASGNSAADGENLTAMANGDIDENLYLPVSERDYQREVVAYREILFDDESFDDVHTAPRTNHIHSNDEFDLYYMRAEE